MKTYLLKTEELKEKKRRSQLILPPCRVCGGKATGIHYGINTCQGCKAFFQRYQKRNEPYICYKNRNCEIVARKRGICSACRMDKCVALGMSKQGIRLGRYTLTERTDTIREVKNIQSTCTIQTCQTINNDLFERRTNLYSLFMERIQEFSQQIINLVCSCRNLNNDHMVAVYSPVSCSSTFSLSDSDAEWSTDGNISPESIEIKYVSGTEYDLNDFKHNQDCSTMTFSEEKCIEKLTALYSHMVVGPQLSQQQIDDMLRKHFDHYQQQINLFGELKALSWEEFWSFHQLTGLDVDGRLKLVEKVKMSMEKFKNQCQNFASHIPGFSSLAINDQISLLTGSIFECDLLCVHRGSNADTGMSLLKTGDILHQNQTIGVFESREKCLMNLNMCKEIQQLKMTNQELAICLGIIMTFTDRCRLMQPGKVEEIQSILTSLLQKQLYIRFKNKTTLHFTKIIDMLCKFRVFTEETKKSYTNMQSDGFTRRITHNVSAQCWIEY